ncbi:MAG: FUSC family membrane protein [Rhizomicrobium sp.]
MRNTCETRPGIFTIPRRLGGALFRIHIENGISVSLGMAVVGLATAVLFGRNMAILAATGALCASVVDQPGALAVKARMFALDIAGTTTLTILSILAAPSPWLLGLLVAAMSFTTGLISGYGRRAIGLGVGAVLSLLFGTATFVGTLPPLWHTAVFAAGGIAYASFALLMGMALDDRNRGMFLGEAVRAFAAYVEAKAELYNPRTRPRQALQSLIEAHAAFTERLQAARDMIFTGRRTPKRLRWMAALIALLDAFDMMLSSDADIETLRQSAHHHLMRRLRALVADIAEDTQELALALVTPGADVACSGHESQLQAIAEEIVRLEKAHDEHNEPLAISAFRSTQHKLQQAVLHLKRLTDAVESRDAAKMPVPKLDLTAFVQRESMNPRLLLSQMTLSSPVMRYAIRLTLAMVSGYVLTIALPGVVHGGWVLLTTALIMRASYSLTKQRRNDRIVGTALGCLFAAILVHVLPRDWLFAPMIVTVGMAHAFATVAFTVTAFAASNTALLQLHFLAPETQAVFFERLIDTLIGAGLAWIFSFLLPSWEWRNIPKLIAAKVKADREYAALALSRQRNDQIYRLARKRSHDATANLATTVSRLVDEPRIDRRALVSLNELLGANYLLASDLASMRVLFRLRAKELEPEATEALLETARMNVALSLGAHEAKDAPLPRLSRRSLGDNIGGQNAMVSLRRRLIHIERTAERVSALAAKAEKEAAEI